jgi:uncharacterized membrane protein YkoI
MRASLGMMLLSALLLSAAPAAAKKMRNPQTKIALAKTVKTTIDQAIAKATAKAPGKVFEVELAKKNGKAVWEIEILSEDGKVVEVDVDATTGEVADTEDKE